MSTTTTITRSHGASVWWLVLGLSALATGIYTWADWSISEPPEALTKATYVGRSSCIDCHQTEYDDFHGSHHDRAMELATENSVLGDFNDTIFERLGVTTRFFRKGEGYFVNTEGPDGKHHDYQIKFTFGVDPLQQYMVEFPDGRVQVLRVSWDTHRRKWFYVPPHDATEERLAPDDPMHWTGMAQNWNTFCAECHSTNLRKNYDLATDSYDTIFSEIDVSCEACHGPGSLHVKLAKSRSLFWDRRHGYGLASLKGLDATPQIETCANCHSRRANIHPQFRPGQPFEDHYHLSLLGAGLYHADGQILDEVYVHGSFLQSKMHSMGVRCTDCHNPHSLKLKFEGNLLCAQCHIPAKYDTPAHHHHKMGTPAASCVECHMPETTYMVVDPRRDHSIRIPRPDLTVSLGTPNACNGCHIEPDETAEWAAEKIVDWYGPNRPDELHGPHWATAIAAGRESLPEAEKPLLEIIQRPQTPNIVRATALELLGQYASTEVLNAFQSALDHDSPLVRRAAVRGLPAISFEQLVRQVAPLLSDPVRSVRIAAALRLLPLDVHAFDRDIQTMLETVTDEYRQQLAMASDRAGSHVELAKLAVRSGDVVKAEKVLRTAIRLQPYRTGIRAELGQLLEVVGGHDVEVDNLRHEEIKLLQRDIEMLPNIAKLRYDLGMLNYKVGDLQSAEIRLAEAHHMQPQNSKYLLGLALLQQERYKLGEEEAFERTLDSLSKLNELDPQNPDAKNLLQALMEMRQERENGEAD